MPLRPASEPLAAWMLCPPHATNVGTWVVTQRRRKRIRFCAEFDGPDARNEAVSYFNAGFRR